MLLTCLTDGVGSDIWFNVYGKVRLKQKAVEKGEEAWAVYCMLMHNPAPSTEKKRNP